MERVKDAHIIRIIEQIGQHYQTNIANRYVRPLLLQLQIDKNTWDQVEILTEKMELYRYQGFHVDDLYRQIIACARLIESCRSGIVPTIRSRLGNAPPGPDKILREMAANNFSSNLQVLADLVNELYVNLIEIDNSTAKKSKPVHTQMPDLHNVGRMLVGR